MKKLWQNNINFNKQVEIFETKDDLIVDNLLATYDVTGTIAHAKMLHAMGIFSQIELEDIQKGLLVIAKKIEENKFSLSFGDEDIHTKIENYLIDTIGEVGKKIHTGRSRNDQVLTAIRLFTKDNLLQIWEQTLLLIHSFIEFAKKYQDIPMPGYTHMQQAMPYSLGGWALAFTSGLLDSLSLVQNAFLLIDTSPLGSAAGFGSPLLIDKNYTAKLLGFKQTQINSLSCQNSRGKLEAQVISSCVSLLTDTNKFASDILFFTTKECDFFEVDGTITTGSSIMPQKKNVDLAELIRSKVHILIGNYTSISSLSTNLISGFNRDMQDMKKPFFESLQTTKDTLCATTILLHSIKPKQQMLEKAITPDILSAYKAIELTQSGIPFRDAYHLAKSQHHDKLKNTTYYVNQNKNLGDMGNLQFTYFEKQLQIFQKNYKIKKNIFEISMNNLLQKGGEKK